MASPARRRALVVNQASVSSASWIRFTLGEPSRAALRNTTYLGKPAAGTMCRLAGRGWCAAFRSREILAIPSRRSSVCAGEAGELGHGAFVRPPRLMAAILYNLEAEQPHQQI